MKSIHYLILFSFLAVAVHGSTVIEPRAKGGYVQKASGTASFTEYSGCGSPACGKTAKGFTAAMSQLAFGSEPGLGAGDACGRCFKLTGTKDPYSPNNPVKPTTIVVKANDLCPVQGNAQACGQTVSNSTNSFGKLVHFDLCEDSGAAQAFFPKGIGALTGKYEEVSCKEWSGTDGQTRWPGGCLADETTNPWPSTGCGNKGKAPP